MVLMPTIQAVWCRTLSVLALSSRFDGRPAEPPVRRKASLSVLALSSRFDGLLYGVREILEEALSVLALSSRFDGQCPLFVPPTSAITFSTRSVESF